MTPWAESDDRQTFTTHLKKNIDEHLKGNVVYGLIEDGEIVDSYFASVGKPVNEQSVFGVASVGKWVTAMAVMRLVDKGILDIDAPVSQYLKRWQLPASQFDNDLVTLRLLLSHTAGIEDGLGHNGFALNEPIQPLTEHLTLAADADPGVNARVVVTLPPGETWNYSGGSYNLIQLIVEDVTQQSFQDAMHQLLFAPLGLQNTHFQVNRSNPLLADYYGEAQEAQHYPNYTSLAATGLYTNLTEIHKLVLENLAVDFRNKTSSSLLSEKSLIQMRRPQAFVGGQPIWGAGVMLFAPTDTGHIIGHGGKSPYLNATVRFDPDKGDGFIMFQTGNDQALASDMATQWTLWKTGKPDIYLVNNRVNKVVQDTILGTFIIISIVLIYWGWAIHEAKKYEVTL
ncbi:beta-lactamase family protein [Aliiglaciecola sp. M165]|nr:beta-lactamase family protein [Aliiglaciecola sp. M165]